MAAPTAPRQQPGPAAAAPDAWLRRANPVLLQKQQQKQQQHTEEQTQQQKQQPAPAGLPAFGQQQQAASAAARPALRVPHRQPQTSVERGRTATLFAASARQNMLAAVMHPHAATGYKDPADPCNRSDKHNGGEYRRFQSTSAAAYAPFNERAVTFRRDGLPVSAVRLPGKPLMAPKLPSAAELGVARARGAAGRRSRISIGRGTAPDPARHFRSVSQLVFTAPRRALGQPNPGIVADDAARGRRQLGLFA